MDYDPGVMEAMKVSVTQQSVSKVGFTSYYVDGVDGAIGADGLTYETALKTVQAAVDKAESWAKIFVKDATYVENVSIPSTKNRIRIEGTSELGTIIAPSTGDAIVINSDRCELANLTAKSGSGTNKSSIKLNSVKDCSATGCTVSGTGTTPIGIYIYCSPKNQIEEITQGTGLDKVIQIEGTVGAKSHHNKITNDCIFEETATYGIYFAGDADNNKIFYNSFGTLLTNGVYLTGDNKYNIIYHNNILATTEAYDVGGSGNVFKENYYASQTGDVDKDGITNLPYAYAGGLDFTPLSQPNLWWEKTLGLKQRGRERPFVEGEIVISDDFSRYSTNSDLADFWVSLQECGLPTLNGTAYYGRYSMQVIIGVGGVGKIRRTFPNPIDLTNIIDISWAHRANAGSKNIYLRIVDRWENYAQYNKTTDAVADTWAISSVNVHTDAPDETSAAPPEFKNVSRIEFKDLEAGVTYLIDYVTFKTIQGDALYISDTEKLRDFIAKTGGTEIGAGKSIPDYLGDYSGGGSVKADLAGLSVTVATNEVIDVVIYPTAEDSATTELADDGSSPAFLAEVAHTGDVNWTTAWTEDIDFEQSGTITVISIYAEIHFAMHSSNVANTATARFQISGDGGGSWVDVSDDLTTTSTAYVDKTRIGTGLWIAAITAGANQLQFRLRHKIDNGAETVTSKIRTDTYFRITYRKS